MDLTAAAAAADEADEDLQLVAAFRAGDRRAFETLVRRHQRPALALARRFVRDRHAAEDLAQRAFLQSLERIDSLRGAYRPWLLRIVANLGKNNLRDAARHAAAHEKLPEESPPPDADEELVRHQRTEAVRAAIAKLSPRQREVVLLRVDGGLPFSEVASGLGITENNAKVTYHLAVKRIRELLGGTDAL